MNNLFDCGISRHHLRTLEEISKPDPVNGEEIKPVTNSHAYAIDFDNVTAEYAKDIKKAKVPTSVDALFQHSSGELYFIEFKSSKPESTQRREELKLNAVEGVLTLMELTNAERSCIRKSVTFLVVFNDDESKEQQTAKARRRDIMQKIGRQLTSKGLKLSRLKHVYFKDAGAMTSEEFDAYITEQNWTSMA